MESFLQSQFNAWHEAEDFRKITDAVEDMPEPARDYDVVMHYARALNNSHRYDEALEQLESVTEAGQADALWHHRTGYALFSLHRYAAAVTRFQAAVALDAADTDSAYLLQESRLRQKSVSKLGDAPNALKSKF